MLRVALMYVASVCVVAAGALLATAGESGALPSERLSQDEIASSRTSSMLIRRQGLIVFSTPFNRHDGFGDGPNGRPTMGGNGTLLRVNGLDAQSCQECHGIVRAGEMPPRLGIGGAGGSNSNAIVMPSRIGVGDTGGGAAEFDGRFANPPFLFGAGGVELVALEMTEDLQRLRREALASPGTPVELISKGVHFGTLTASAAGVLDTSGVVGVKPDLVVRPFGRKGEFISPRAFDIGAMQFHFGMQPVEKVGENVDADGDGVVNEITVGDLSALHVFAASMERPVQDRRDRTAERGFARFQALGCSGCHVPALETRSRQLPLRFPEVEADPRANVYRTVDLAAESPGFDRVRGGGVVVPLFSDLRLHDMGPGLQENFHRATEEENRTFVTARLWGVADSAPYLHDGRATTLTDAILAHGGEAQAVRDRFEDLGDEERDEVLAFLRTLRTPAEPAKSLIAYMANYDESHERGDKKPRASKHDWRAVLRERRHSTWWERLARRCEIP